MPLSKKIGRKPDQIPVHGHLGRMAYQDPDAIQIKGGKVAGKDVSRLVAVNDEGKIPTGIIPDDVIPTGLTEHLENTENPHGVTKTQIGLDQVDNTADVDKPVSTAMQVVLDNKADTDHTHPIEDVVGLSSALESKADASHTHAAGQVSGLAPVATSGTYNDLQDKPTIPVIPGVATTSTHGLMASSDKSKLNGIAAGATKNATDAQLRDRSTHTGTQSMETISGLTAALDEKVNLDLIGAIDGIAPLGPDQKIPPVYLPGSVDNVVEVADYASLPAEGESGKIYTTIDDGKVYRWGGTTYVEIAASPGSTDAVPEGAANLYFKPERVRATALSGLSLVSGVVISAADSVLSAFGKLQKQVSDLLASFTSHSQNTSNPHSVTKAQVGLGEVDNTSDADKPISTATQGALDQLQNDLGTKANSTHGHGVGDISGLHNVAISGQYSDLAGTPTIPTLPSIIPQAEAEAGTATTARLVSAQRIRQAIEARVSAAGLSGNYNDLTNRPSIPAPQVPADWNATEGPARILNKPDLATTLPTATLTEMQDGTQASVRNMSPALIRYAIDTRVSTAGISGKFGDLLEVPPVVTAAEAALASSSEVRLWPPVRVYDTAYKAAQSYVNANMGTNGKGTRHVGTSATPPSSGVSNGDIYYQV